MINFAKINTFLKYTLVYFVRKNILLDKIVISPIQNKS